MTGLETWNIKQDVNIFLMRVPKGDNREMERDNI